MAIGGLIDTVVGAVNNYRTTNSLQFRANANSSIDQQNVTVGNRKTLTYATWLKIGTYNQMFASYSGMSLYDHGTWNGGFSQSNIRLDWDTEGLSITVYDWDGAAIVWQVSMDRRLIDPTAWYHLCVAIDTTQSTASDRVKIYINGVRETVMDIANYPSLNYDTYFNSSTGSNTTRKIGRSAYTGTVFERFDGVLADTYFIDGLALTSDAFGVKTDTSFVPRKYNGPVGVNGFYFNYQNLVNVENNLTFNTQYSGTSLWLLENATITANAGTAPDGSNTATRLTVDTQNKVHGINRLGFDTANGIIGNTRYAISAYFKPIDYTGFRIQLDANAIDSNTVATVDFFTTNTTVTVTGGANTTGTLTPLADGWYRATMCINTSASPGPATVKYRWLSGTSQTFLGDGTSGGLIWGHQTERASAAGPLIKTGATKVTLTTTAAVDVSLPTYGYNTFVSNNMHFGSNTFIYDQTYDSPSMYSDGNPVYGRGNYCTLNVADTNDNTAMSGAGNYFTANATNSLEGLGTIPLPSTGKWYWEVLINNVANSANAGINLGLVDARTSGAQQTFLFNNPRLAYICDGRRISVGGMDGANTTGLATVANNDVVGIAVDTSSGNVSFYKNNTLITSLVSTVVAGSSGRYFKPLVEVYSNSAVITNFGRVPFKYTPPTGYVSLNTNNLPTPSITRPKQHFDIQLWTGNGNTSPRTLTGLEFSPNLFVSKNRTSNVNWWHAYDSVRGAGYGLFPNAPGNDGYVSTEQFQTGAGYVSSFNSDGVTLNWSTNGIDVNASGSNYIGFNWRESVSSGMDIVTWTGDGINGRTISHNLGVTPKMIWVKSRSIDSQWRIYHVGLSPNGMLIFAVNNEFVPISTATSDGGVTAVSSTNFTLGQGTTNMNGVNASGQTYVAYVFAEIAGYSRFGVTQCNASRNGPYIWTGFKPALVMVKLAYSPNIASGSTYGDWLMYNSKVDKDIGLGRYELRPNSTLYEAPTGTDIWTFANGFKTTEWVSVNDTTSSYLIYAAWADVPFKYSLAR